MRGEGCGTGCRPARTGRHKTETARVESVAVVAAPLPHGVSLLPLESLRPPPVFVADLVDDHRRFKGFNLAAFTGQDDSVHFFLHGYPRFILAHPISSFIEEVNVLHLPLAQTLYHLALIFHYCPRNLV